MKKILVTLVLLIVSTSVFAEGWTKQDTYREVAFQTLWVIDALQTHSISENYDSCMAGYHVHGCGEQNNMLGAHPTIGAVNRYFLVGASLHAAVSYCLPAKVTLPLGFGTMDLRQDWQYVTIGSEVGYVGYNASRYWR